MPGGHHRLGPEDPVGPEGRRGSEDRAAPRRSCTRVRGAASGRHRRREVIPAAIGSAVAGNLTVMASSMIRVWLPEPDAAELMGGLPDGMVADVWTGDEQLPDSAGAVEVVVLPFGVPPSRMPVLAKLPRLRLIQLMSAGAEHVIPFVPPGVTLCNARGVHDPAVAEWVLAVILAQVRQLPRFLAAQQAGTWDPVRSEPLAGQTVLIVGYGSIGEAVGRMLVPFGGAGERIARRRPPPGPGRPPRCPPWFPLPPPPREGWWTRGFWPRCMTPPCWSTRPAGRSW